MEMTGPYIGMNIRKRETLCWYRFGYVHIIKSYVHDLDIGEILKTIL